ncbi:MAG: MHYT domain-containing protein, partial [Asticcacaulis sp.]
MFDLISCVRDLHDLRLVALAAAICVLGCATLLLLLRRAEECRTAIRPIWLGLAAFSGGIGVWSTHFVAMLAYQSPMPMTFDLSQTLLSIGYIFMLWGGALYLLFPARTWPGAIGAGVMFAAGVAAMHYTGMMAIRLSAQIHIDIVPCVIGVVLAAVLFSLAFAVRVRAASRWQLPAALGLLVLGIVALHFTGMSAVSFTPDPRIVTPDSGIDRNWLIVSIVGVTCLLICVATLAVFLDRYLTDLRGLIDATMEGFVVVREGRIVQANDALCHLSGYSQSELTSQR